MIKSFFIFVSLFPILAYSQNTVFNKNLREIKVKSVSMTSKGLAVNFHGENIRLENLAASL